MVKLYPLAFPSPSTLTKSPNPVTHTPQRFSGACWRTGSTTALEDLPSASARFSIHGGAVDLHVGTEPVRSVVEIVQPAFQVQFLNVRVRKADFIKGGQTVGRDLWKVIGQIGKRLAIEEGNEIGRTGFKMHRIEQAGCRDWFGVNAKEAALRNSRRTASGS